jgi:nicotinamidase-related amidase
MAVLDPDRSTVVIVDMQGRLMEIVHRHERVLETTCRLARLAGMFDIPIVVTEQYPEGLGPTHEAVVSAVAEAGARSFKVEKQSFGCCGEPSFLEALAQARPGLSLTEQQIVLVGIEAHICVVQTVLDLLARGVEVQLCWEAVSSRGAEYREWALQRMQQAGATITNHESVGFEWAKTKGHPQFKAMSRMFREGQPE